MKRKKAVIPPSGKAKTKIRKLEKPAGDRYVLQLFIAGILPNSSRAVVNINAICEAHLKGRYDLEIVDIYQQPALARSEDIVAVPVLIKKSPRPEGRLIGDLSNVEEVLKGLELTNQSTFR